EARRRGTHSPHGQFGRSVRRRDTLPTGESSLRAPNRRQKRLLALREANREGRRSSERRWRARTGRTFGSSHSPLSRWRPYRSGFAPSAGAWSSHRETLAEQLCVVSPGAYYLLPPPVRALALCPVSRSGRSSAVISLSNSRTKVRFSG